jgi:AcrR family transcriptional regulator
MSEATAVDGHEARSAKTRTQLIEAAIEVIGSVGYEAASTRLLAKAARTNLSAIPYHFGGKKELYLAAAQAIADYARVRFEEVAQVLEARQRGDKPGGFEEALVRLFHLVVEDAEPRAWTSFLARCAYENDEAFALIQDQAISPLMDRLNQSAGEIFANWPARDVALRLRISTIVTAIFSFKFLRGFVMRSMDWKGLHASGARQIEEMIRSLCRSDFLRAQVSH